MPGRNVPAWLVFIATSPPDVVDHDCLENEPAQGKGDITMLLIGRGCAMRSVEATVTNACPKCMRSTIFRLEKVRTWFTLFSLPVIPYQTQYWLLCADCQCGFELSPEEYQQLNVDISRSEDMGVHYTYGSELRKSA